MRRPRLPAFLVAAAVAIAPSKLVAQSWTQIAPAPVPEGRREAAFAYDPVRRHIILHGGRGTRSGAELDDTWVLDDDVWTRLEPPATPGGPTPSLSAWDTTANRLLLTGRGFTDLEFGTVWSWDGTTWSSIVPDEAPPPRGSAAVAFDGARNRLVLVGGERRSDDVVLADTWEFDGTTWSPVEPLASPTPHLAHRMAYDPLRQVIVLQGGLSGPGTSLSETWEYDGQTWRENTLAGRPTGAVHAMTWDPVEGKILVVSTTPDGDLGAHYYDGLTWVDATPEDAPRARSLQGLAFDEQRGRALYFGADIADPENQGWIFAGGRWTQLLPVVAPGPPGPYTGLVFDTARQQPLLLGPDSSDAVWSYDGDHWRPQATTGLPVRLDGPFNTVHDSGRGLTVVLYGGALTFELEGNTWTQRTIDPPGGGSRSSPAMAYDPDRGRIVLFGGIQTIDVFHQDTWEYDGDRWTEVKTPTLPPGRQDAAMTYDSDRGRMILFGGLGDPYYLTDTWEYDGEDWTPVEVSVPPPQMGSVTMAYDPRARRTVLFGRQTQGPDQVFEYDGRSWTGFTTDPMPSADDEAVFTYDEARGQLVLFAHGSSFSDPSTTWVYTPTTGKPPVDGGPGDGGAGDGGAADGSSGDGGTTDGGGGEDGAGEDGGAGDGDRDGAGGNEGGDGDGGGNGDGRGEEGGGCNCGVAAAGGGADAAGDAGGLVLLLLVVGALPYRQRTSVTTRSTRPPSGSETA